LVGRTSKLYVIPASPKPINCVLSTSSNPPTCPISRWYHKYQVRYMNVCFGTSVHVVRCELYSHDSTGLAPQLCPPHMSYQMRQMRARQSISAPSA
jgi:hypothetical protein